MKNLLVLNADKDTEALEYARTIGGVLAGAWFKKEGIVDMEDKSLTDRVNNADAMVMSQYEGSLTWYLVNTGGNLVVRDLVSPSRVKALYFMIEINVEMYWDREYIEEELEEILAQASFGGTAGKRRVTERYYKMLTYIAHMEDNENDDDFVALEDIGTNANKDLIASRILKYKEILSAKVDWGTEDEVFTEADGELLRLEMNTVMELNDSTVIKDFGMHVDGHWAITSEDTDNTVSQLAVFASDLRKAKYVIYNAMEHTVCDSCKMIHPIESLSLNIDADLICPACKTDTE